LSSANIRKRIRRDDLRDGCQSTRYAHRRGSVELSADSIPMVGTDGRRLARMVAPAEGKETTPPRPAGKAGAFQSSRF